jgi:hypothetical protein
MPRNPYEDEDDRPPRCDLRWSPGCDDLGIEHMDPEWACAACGALCELCQEHEWVERIETRMGKYTGRFKACQSCIEERRREVA